jgi:hypothetical protein
MGVRQRWLFGRGADSFHQWIVLSRNGRGPSRLRWQPVSYW